VGSLSRLNGVWASLSDVTGSGFRHFAALGLALLGTVPTPAIAQGVPDVDVSCKRLEPEQADEFLARVRLVLRAARPDALPLGVKAECSEDEAWILWKADAASERLSVEASPNLVEGFLDAVEERLSKGSEPASKPDDAAAAPGETKRSALELPPFERVRPRPESNGGVRGGAARNTRPSVGGLGFGLVGERWPAPVEIGIGPRVEVAVGSGAFALVLCETLRLGVGADFNTLAFDTQGGVSWGAPFAPDYSVGLLLLGGAEWFSVFGGSGPNSLQTESTGTLMLGGRVANRTGGVALWAGLDALYRFEDLGFDQPFDAELARFTVLGSLGVLLLVDSGSR